MLTVEMLHLYLGDCDWRIQVKCHACNRSETVTRAGLASGFNGTEPPYHRSREWQRPQYAPEQNEDGCLVIRVDADANYFVQRDAKCRCGASIDVEAKPKFNGLFDYVDQLRIAAIEDKIEYADDMWFWKAEEGTTHPLADLLFAAKYNLRTITSALERVTCYLFRSNEGFMHHFYKKLHAANPSIASQWSLAFYKMKSTDDGLETDTEEV